MLHFPVERCEPVNGKLGCNVSYIVHSADSAVAGKSAGIAEYPNRIPTEINADDRNVLNLDMIGSLGIF